MADTKQDQHDEAREKAEDALGAYARGDHRAGDKLADEAQALDRDAVIEVIQDIDEDAGSDPNAVPQDHQVKP
jgi:hypothetical protein